MEQEIIEGNKLIAEFMNEGKGVPLWEGFDHKSYHTSWDWLMPVISKINLIYESGKVSNRGKVLWDEIYSMLEKKSIERVWLAVVEFIKWYNQNKK